MINDSTPPDSGFEQAFNELTDTSIEPSESPELEEAAEQVVEEIEEVENEIVYLLEN